MPLPCPSRPLGCGRERPPCFWPWFGRGAVACVHAPPRPVGTPHHLSRGGGPCRMGSLPSHSSLQEGDHGDEEAQVATLTTGGERGRETPVQAVAWLETVTWLFCCGPAAGCGPSAWWWCEGWRLENGGAGPGSLLRPRPPALGPRGHGRAPVPLDPIRSRGRCDRAADHAPIGAPGANSKEKLAETPSGTPHTDFRQNRGYGGDFHNGAGAPRIPGRSGSRPRSWSTWADRAGVSGSECRYSGRGLPLVCGVPASK